MLIASCLKFMVARTAFFATNAVSRCAIFYAPQVKVADGQIAKHLLPPFFYIFGGNKDSLPIFKDDHQDPNKYIWSMSLNFQRDDMHVVIGLA